MKLKVRCDFCGIEFERYESMLKNKKYHFCSKKCLADFSNKSKNPDGYLLLKDYQNMSENMTRLNISLNPTRMTDDVRKKIRKTCLNTGKQITYEKYYGKHTHRVMAEKMLGRKLIQGEIVHHRDSNKRNNTPENLVIFNSQSDHAKHHAELRWFIRELAKMDGGDA